MVSRAPRVPTFFSTKAVLREDAGFLTERRLLLLPIVDVSDHHIEMVFGSCGAHRQRERNDKPERSGEYLDGFH